MIEKNMAFCDLEKKLHKNLLLKMWNGIDMVELPIKTPTSHTRNNFVFFSTTFLRQCMTALPVVASRVRNVCSCGIASERKIDERLIVEIVFHLSDSSS